VFGNIINFVMTPATSKPQDGYTNLLNVWNKAKTLPKTDDDSLANLAYGFWHAGNTLDTFMDYYKRAKPAGYQKEAAHRAEEAIAVFHDAVGEDPLNPPSVPPKVAWWDDYGWWGVAFLKAFALTTTFPEPYRYLLCAKTCWDFMDKGGRHHNDSDPNEKNGTWNHYPGGVQNLITNSLFLNLSAQLYGLTNDQKYLNGACDQFAWFYHWFTQGALHSVTSGGNLVYPSCGTGKSVNEESIQNCKGQYWTGDQGAVLGALNELLKIAGDAAPKIKGPSNLAKYLQDTCASIAQAVTSNADMVWANTGVLYEQSWYDLNGAVGKGVLMRYLAPWAAKYQKFIGDNAFAATTTESDGYFRFSWANVPGRSITGKGNPLLKQLTRQCAGQDAFNSYLLVPGVG
jgi:hypothetical protein